MPRIAVFAKNFGEVSETFIHDEVRHHTRYDVDVLCNRRRHSERFPHPSVHVDRPKAFAWHRRSRTFARLLRERDYALVHAHFGTGAVLAAPLARRAALPLVVSFHGYDVPRLWAGRGGRYRRRAPAMLRQMALGLCASNELYELLHEFGVPRGRLRVHRLGIDLSRFRQPGPRAERGEGRVAMVGRLVPKKGFTYALRALALAAEKVPLRAEIVGEGPEGASLRALAAGLGLGDRVVFRGAQAPEEVAELLRASDVLLCPSVVAPDGNRESGLLVAKEASACEAVPIGTVHGGLPEIVEDGVTGWLVPERNPAALAERLVATLSDVGLRERFGRAARRKIELEYDIRERNRALESAYDDVLAAIPSPGAGR